MASGLQFVFPGALVSVMLLLSKAASKASEGPSFNTQFSQTRHVTEAMVEDAFQRTNLDKPTSSLDKLLKMTSNEIFVDHRHKRTDIFSSTSFGLSWTCNTTIQWRELGVLHFPRFIKEVTCAETSCYWGFYTCRPQYYNIKALTARNSEDSADHKVPDELKPFWKFVDVSISVGCGCSV